MDKTLLSISTLPSAELLREIISYDADTGEMLWKARRAELFKGDAKIKKDKRCEMWNKRWSGKPAVNRPNGNGYLAGQIFGKSALAHRVAWKIHHGKDPKEFIDHINGDRSDNSISNLREVDRSVNQKNSKLQANNKTGVAGVYFCKRERKYIAYIKANGRSVYIGGYKTLEEARKARKSAESKNGYHSNHGRIV